ncbi:MAG: hypothetical protein PVSMB4_18890 [Ktedonobacterales bacterium]
MTRNDSSTLEMRRDGAVTLSGHAAAAGMLIRTVAVLGILPVAVRLFPVARLVTLLTPHTPRPQQPSVLAGAAYWVDRLVDRRPFRFWGHCLRRSLALYYLATHAGYPVRIVLGIRRDGASVTGHGWLELDGHPFLEPGEHPEARFVVMERLPRAGTAAGGW